VTPGSAAARVWILTALVGSAGAALTLSVADQVAVRPVGWLPWWMLAVAFGLVEVKVIHLAMRRGVHSLSLSEIPLLLGLVFVGPLPTIGARMVGSGIALVLYRRQRGVKLCLNLANFLLEAGLAAALYLALLGPADPVGPHAWRATYLALLSTATVTALVVALAISMVEGRSLLRLLREVLPAGTVAAATNTSLALAAVTLAWFEPTSLWLMAVVSAMVLLAYQAYTRLRLRHSSLELLYDFSAQAGAHHDFEAVVGTLLERALTMLRGQVGRLVLLPSPGQERGLLVCLERDGQTVITHPTEEQIRADVAVRLTAEGHARLLSIVQRDPVLRAQLGGLGVRDAIIAPMRSGDGPVGALLVGERLEDVRTFDEADLRLLETLANHASVALHNGRLVHQLRLEAAEKEYQALHDALTGLANRTLFHRRVDRAVAAARGTGRGGCVLLVDLDRFKEVNDTLGHHVGDALLRELADRLRAAVGDKGTIARLGGDEFAILLPRVSEAADAIWFATLIDVAVTEAFLIEDELTLEIGASVGIALFPEHGDDAVTLLQRADVAMYAAKAARTGPQVYAPERDSNSIRRLSLVAELRKAIDQGEIAVHYQPQAALPEGRVVGVEALVRWNHPHLGPVQPDEFIAVAEHSGHIRPLTRYVLGAALRQARAWHLAGLDLGVAVNLSPRALLDDDLPEAVERLLTETGVDAGRLTIELTESAIMADPEHAVGLLTRLSDLGVQLSIDDFGTGYSSLSYLKRLPVNELKIDRSFVRTMSTDPSDAAIVRSTIELAHNLGLSVVAEGIEDAATFAELAALGCDVGQGFLLSRPLAAARVEEWLTVWAAQLDALGVNPSDRPAALPPVSGRRPRSSP
jgi:diguanylate cyclase (GGDEF)-like protein